MTTSSPKLFSETTQPHSLLDVKNLNKNFAGFQAIDGVNFNGNRNELLKILSGDKGVWLLTIKRENVFFEVIVRGTLGASFKQTSPEETIEVLEGLKNHTIHDISEYHIYEV